VHLLVDSTGLKLCGAGEWLHEKHGTKLRRSWRKLHLGMDAGTGQIVASLLTTKDVDDGSQVGPLLDQVEGPLASFTGDGADDQDGVTASVTERDPEAAIIVPPRANAMPSDTAATAPTQRDRHLQHVEPRGSPDIAKHGRLAWQAASGYTKRARAETGMSRFKQVIGDGLRSHTDGHQATEVGVAVHVLNRMLLVWTAPGGIGCARMRSVLISNKGDRPWTRLAELEWIRRSMFFSCTGRTPPKRWSCARSCGARRW